MAPPPMLAPVNTIGSGLTDSQITSGPPASTVGAGSMVITTSSVTGPHGPEGSAEVSVKVTEPAAISEALGVYSAFKSLALVE